TCGILEREVTCNGSCLTETGLYVVMYLACSLDGVRSYSDTEGANGFHDERGEHGARQRPSHGDDSRLVDAQLVMVALMIDDIYRVLRLDARAVDQKRETADVPACEVLLCDHVGSAVLALDAEFAVGSLRYRHGVAEQRVGYGGDAVGGLIR